MSLPGRLPAAIAGATLLALPLGALAQMSLTSQGTADGFTLSTFASSLPNYGTASEGPFGTASTSDGHILVDDSTSSTIYVFKDVDGQTPSTALNSSTFKSFASALTNDGGTIYGSGGLPTYIDSRGGLNGGNLLKFSNAGALGATILVNGGVAGVATNPLNGHLITEGVINSGFPPTETLLDVNPLTPSAAKTIASWSALNEGDGVVVSADGTIAYVAFKMNKTVVGYNIASGSPVFTASFASLDVTPDGMGIIQKGTSKVSAGELVVNTNEGDVFLIDPSHPTAAPVLIASGGSRGDFTGQDLLNGSLFLSQTDSVLRLSCGTGCSFGGGSSGGGGGGVPEPATLGLLGLGLLGAQLAQRARRRR